MRVSLSRCPSASKVHSISFQRLSGGLNLWELDYRLNSDQSPYMKNLWWQDGVLQSRDGQEYLSDDTSRGVGYTSTTAPFWGYVFFHIGTGIWYADPETENFTMKRLVTGVPENRGTFFRYGDNLYYKNKGGFFRITWDGSAFAASQVAADPYVPVTILNADPAYGSGDLYQPVNRLTGKRTVKYNAVKDQKVYHLMANAVALVDKVVVDGATLKAGTGYTVDLSGKTVTFTTAPPVTTPATNNTVEITFTVKDDAAYNAIMDCEHAFVSGEDQNLCILLGGCDAQPNAVFWNSNDYLGMNDSYFPDSYFNLVGDTEDPVTGFGKQYSDTIVFKARGVGKLALTVEDINGRNTLSFTYANVNSKVGCDLPWSIQLIENNLVFCNTYQGVQILRSSSAAYENNVECISRNVHGHGTSIRTMYRDEGAAIAGLLDDVRKASVVTSFDDDDRYWLCANGNVYLWDYVVSSHSKPSWFYLTGIGAVSVFKDDSRNRYHLDGQGRVTKFVRTFSDYGAAFEKFYQLPTQYFGGYDRLKDIESVMLAVRSDTDTEVQIEYSTDYETRADLTPIRSYTWRLVPRNLAYRCLAVPRFAHVARRRPGCRHVRHFTMTLSNNTKGCDLALVSAQIFFKYQGKER